MPRRRKHGHVYGPHRDTDRRRGRTRWRVVVVTATGEREAYTFASEVAATKCANKARTDIAGERRVSEALEDYEQHLVAKGNRRTSIDTTLTRLRRWFRAGRLLSSITPRTCEKVYEKRTGEVAVSTHRAELAEVKTLFRWCVAQGWLPRSPAEDVEGVGRRRKGKPQLGVDDAARWWSKALELCEAGGEGALAATLALCGLRASEIVGLRVRDVDRGGALLWIGRAKTEAGERPVPLPAEVAPWLAQRTWMRLPGAGLWSAKHWRDWVRHQVRRVCEEAGVPVVSAHGLRGTYASLQRLAGLSPAQIAPLLGHASERITRDAYVDEEAEAEAGLATVLRLVR